MVSDQIGMSNGLSDLNYNYLGMSQGAYSQPQ
jgi:hypothetical protein